MSVFLEFTPKLPDRIAPHCYDLALFFDFSLRASGGFFIELQNSLVPLEDILILNSRNNEPLKLLKQSSDWHNEIASLDNALNDAVEYHSICVVAGRKGWLISQDLPISMGVALFKSSDSAAVDLYERFRVSDWFFDMSHVKSGLANAGSSLYGEYGRTFLELLIRNYDVSSGYQRPC